jgi:hypothetical protein
LHLERENKTSDLQGREGNLESAEEWSEKFIS